MCAIAGGITNRNAQSLKRMLTHLAHRGPDDEGAFFDADHKVMLGHRRLSILDLSTTGHQPMLNTDGSVCVIFNGEIYNYKKITEELKTLGYVFQSTSDTEVIVHGYTEYGADIFKKIDGMWAVALYDKNREQLILSRDPAGIKPLYVYRADDELLFASEINALASILPPEALSTNKKSLTKFLTHGYIYGDETIYNEITRLPAGWIHTYSLPTLERLHERIYSPSKRFEVKGMKTAVKTFNELFSASVRATLQADVPVGLFLSGGIDSALTGYHIKAAGAQLTAFTIGFGEQSFDESVTATRIAKHLGFPHVAHIMHGEDVAKDIEHILDSFGEPFGDTSALPTYYISKLARQHGIKVALGGDGADELFGGYPTHYLPLLVKLYGYTPRITDTLLLKLATYLPSDFTKLGTREKIARFVSAARNPYKEAHARWKQVFTSKDLYNLLRPEYYPDVTLDSSFDTFFNQVQSTSQNHTDEVMKVDFLTFLPNSCLVKSDIASMQHGLEIRVPFLNKDIIDFAWYLPTSLKTKLFSTKRLLRRSLAAYLPKDIIGMKKQGFVPPLAEWLTNELRPAMLRILSPENVARAGFLEYSYIASLIEDHLARRVDNSKKIWVLMSLVRFFSK